MKLKKTVSFALAIMLLLVCMAGCSKEETTPAPEATPEAVPETVEPAPPEEESALVPYDTVGTDVNLEQKYKFDTVYIKDGVLDQLYFDVNMPDPKSPTVNTYNYYPNAVYQYDMAEPMLDVDGVAMISINELQKVFGPGTKYDEADGSYTFYYKYNAYVFHSIDNNPVWTEEITETKEIVISDIKADSTSITVDGAAVELAAAPIVEDGVLYLPLVDFAQAAMGLGMVQEGEFSALYKSAEPIGDTFAPERLDQINACIEDTEYKMTGNRWFLIYHEDINKLHPYQLFIPDGYDGSPAKFSLMLHGGTGNENAALVRGYEGAGLKVEPYADEYDYMLLLPNAIANTSWGNKTSDDPVMTELYAAAERGVYLCMEDAMGRYNIDEDALFVTGNSMGSSGTIWFSQNDTDVHNNEFSDINFLAGAPTSGAGTIENIDIPLLYVWGDQDSLQKKLDQYFESSDEYRSRSTGIVIENGHHSWSYESHMDAIFTFYDAVLDGTWLQDGEVTSAAFTAGSNIAKTNAGDIEMAHAAIDTGDGVVKVAVSDLEALFDNFQSYRVLMNDVIGLNWYASGRNEDINGGAPVRIETNAMTLRYGNQTVNLKLRSEDADEAIAIAVEKGNNNADAEGTITGVEITSVGDGVNEIRHDVYGNGDGTKFIRYADFTIGELSSPVTVIDDEVYVPVVEIMQALGMEILG